MVLPEETGTAGAGVGGVLGGVVGVIAEVFVGLG
jgi:hypothetical protein